LARNLELNGSLRLLLHDNGSRSDSIAMRYIADAQLHEIASSKLAVDSEVEQGEARTIADRNLEAGGNVGRVVEIVSMPSRPSISLTNFA
jgi:hypothetical protein